MDDHNRNNDSHRAYVEQEEGHKTSSASAPLFPAFPGHRESHSDPEWRATDSDALLHPTITTDRNHPAVTKSFNQPIITASLIGPALNAALSYPVVTNGHARRTGEINQAEFTGLSTPKSKEPPHQSSKGKSSRSPTISPQLHPVTQPTASQITLRAQHDEQDITCHQYTARKVSEKDDLDGTIDSTTPSSPASLPSWIDPLEDWDGSMPEAPEGWLDPLINDPLSSDSSSTSSPSPLGDTATKKRKQPHLASPAHDMPGEGHKGKNVPKIPKDTTWVRGRLETYGLIQNDRNAYKRYPHLAAQVNKIIDRKRKSEVTPEEFDDFQFVLNTYDGFNEDTVLAALLPFIIKLDRTVQVAPVGSTTGGVQGPSTVQGPAGSLSEEDGWEVKAFIRAGLVTVVNREFARTFQAVRDDETVLDKDLIKAMAKEDGMTNPKPDRTYAVMRNMYKFLQNFRVPAHLNAYLEVMRDVHHPFFILEGNSHQGSSVDAANSACRGGASLVRTARLMRAELGEMDIQGADHRTFVFSATWSPLLIELWVHWAEVLPDQPTVFHMTKVASRALSDEVQFGQARRILHNILDWGCGERFEGLVPLYEAIETFQQKGPTPSKAQGGEQSTASPNKKQKT
ncbi:MAG: hypothetical protein Q9170_007095 [Blastenia crenularia]